LPPTNIDPAPMRAKRSPRSEKQNEEARHRVERLVNNRPGSR
jgi:hypothetical protein